MKKQIKIKDKEIEYILKTVKRSKHIRLSIDPDRGLVATKPVWVSARKVEDFIKEKGDWILLKLEDCRNAPRRVPTGTPTTHKDFLKNKADAYRFVKSRIDFWNSGQDFKFSKINIRNQKTRWGSCSHNGNLSFSYKILMLPPRMADYIIVHELCHLKEFNHSPKFWALVERFVPDYKEIKKELRKRGLEYY